MTSTIEFSASLLAANPLQLHNAITSMIAAGIYHAHYDIMDMHYVNNLGLNIQTLSAIHQQFPKLTIDLHYMVKNIDHALAHTQLNPQIRTIYFHPAAAKQPEETIQNIHSAGIAAGIAINPTDAPTHYTHLLKHTSHVLIMGVTPGFSGQAFQNQAIKQLEYIKKNANKKITYALDGGMNPSTIPLIPTNSVDRIILGSALFNNNSIDSNIQDCILACSK